MCVIARPKLAYMSGRVVRVNLLGSIQAVPKALDGSRSGVDQIFLSFPALESAVKAF